MAFGGGGFGGFGGGGFGQSQNMFGQQQQSNPFGGSSIFGQPSSSAFGVSSSGFGFGVSQSGFGVTSSAFGTGGGGAFGGFGSPVNSQMAFGAQPSSQQFAFGQSQTGFGGMSQPFGGQPSSPFGGSGFGNRPQSSSAFGGNSGMGGGFGTFGQQQSSSPFGFQTSQTGFGTQQANGTAVADWQKTATSEGATGTSGGSNAQYVSITAMQQYQGKSVEELRLEDYRAGRKSTGGMQQQQQQNTSFMGAPQSSSAFGSFGKPSSSPFSFSSSPFQQSTSIFQSKPAFGGGFSQPSFQSSSGFNFSLQQSSAPFQTSSSPFNFNQSSSAFNNPFQQQQSAPFAQPTSQPGFNFSPSSAPFQPFSSAQSFFSPQPQSQNQFSFNQSSAPLFQISNPFSQPAASTFNFTTQQQQQQQQNQQQQVLMPQIGVNPYGSYPQLPVIPPPKYGITASKPSTSRMPIMRAQVPSRRIISSLNLKSRMKGNSMLVESLRALQSPSKSTNDASTQASQPFKLSIRKDRKQLFIRDELPNVEDEAALYAGQQNDQDGEEEEQTPEPSHSHHTSFRQNRILNFNSSTPETIKPQRGSVSLQAVKQVDDDDDYINNLLPIVTEQDYYIRPSLVQLASMARYGGEEELMAVINFTVGCEGLGSVTFLEPVDVRKMDICSLIRFVKGGIEVFYNDEKDDKPEVGSSLNKKSEVTLLQMYREDPKTKRALTDQVSIEKFRKQLESVCRKQGCEMVSYNPELQQWKFKVEHFSKYGIAFEMPELEESDDDDDQEDINLEGSNVETENIQRGTY